MTDLHTIIHLLRDSDRPASHAKLMDDAADELENMREALEYYANPDTWKLLKDNDENGNPAVMPRSWFSDRGTTAIEALKGIKP